MNIELAKILGPLVDTQPAYNLVSALWLELPSPVHKAFVRRKLEECAEDMEQAAKHLRAKLKETK